MLLEARVRNMQYIKKLRTANNNSGRRRLCELLFPEGGKFESLILIKIVSIRRDKGLTDCNFKSYGQCIPNS